MIKTDRGLRRVCIIMGVIIFSLILAFVPIKASAEAHGNFYIPDGAVPVGDTFEVTVEFTAGDVIGTVQAAVTYNESDIEFVSSDFASGGGGIVNINGFPGSETQSMTVELKFRALREGSSQINLTNGTVMSPDGVMLSGSVTAYATITVGAAYESDDSSDDTYDSYTDYSYSDSTGSSDGLKAVLQSLSVPYGELKPAFSPGIYNYTVNVDHDVIVFEPEGVTGSESDTIWYEGAIYLSDGKNIQTITVTSADKLTSNVYTLTIYREYGDEDSDESDADVETADGETQYESDESYEGDESFSEQTASSTVQTDVTTSRSVIPDDGKTGMDDLRDTLMPALYVAMAVIVLAVVILIVWIRTKMKNRLK